MGTADFPAVVLAAGEGRRLAPLTDTRPKPMLPVANRPILEYVLEAIATAGLEEVVVVVGHRAERIRTHVGDGADWGLDITYVEQTPQLGTGHAVLQAESQVDGPFLVFNGDRILDPVVVEQVVSAHQPETTVVATTLAEQPSNFGVVEVDGSTLVGVHEKPLNPSPRAIINAGVYGFGESIFDRIRQTEPVGGEQAITSTLAALAEDETVRAVRYDGRWLDVTYLWDLPAVTNSLVSDLDPLEPSGGHIAESAILATDVAIAPDVHIGSNAVVAGGTALGPSTTVGPAAVVENSVVMAGATVETGAVVRDAVVGANATVGANTTIGGGSATVVVDGTTHDGVTLGGVVGDNARVGPGGVLEAGTVVGTNAMVDAGVTLAGRIGSNVEVVRG